MKKIIFLSILYITIAAAAQAQVQKISIQAAGLTCSMCSNAILKSLQQLSFVKDVDTDLKNSIFTVIPDSNSFIDFDKIKKKVEDAGFSVIKMTASIQFHQQPIANDSMVVYNGHTLHFLQTNPQILDGVREVQILDKGFVTTKTFKANTSLTQKKCYVTGVYEPCCTKPNVVLQSQRIYHVLLM